MSSGIWDDGKALLKPYSIQGNWNASTNTPNLTTVTQEGYAWIVSTAGSTNLGGITDWLVNDIAIKTIDGWAKSRPGATNWGAIEGTLSDQTDLQNALNLKANSSAVVNLSTNQTVNGIKTFNSSPVVPTPTSDSQASTKKYVDDGLNTKQDKLTGSGTVVSDDGTLSILDTYPISVGPITNPSYHDNGDGTLTVNSFDCFLYSSTDYSGLAKKYTLAEQTLSLIDGIESYIVVDYNNGSPTTRVETLRSNINGSSIYTVVVAWRQGTIIHTIDNDSFGLGLANKIHRMISNTNPYSRYQNEGLIISETNSPNPRTIIISSAIVYANALPISVLAFNSSTDLFTLAYVTNGEWAYTNQNVYDNTQYNPSTGLETLSNNKYSCRWFYRSIGDIKQTFYILGDNQYNSYAEAEASNPPSVSVLLKNHCILVGRSIIQKSATSGITESTFGISFSGASIISHNDTTNRDMAGNHAKLVPLTDSTTAIQFTKANGTTALYNLDSTNNNQKFGDIAGGNTTEIESDGTIKFNGNATIFDDISLSGLSFSGGGASAPDIINFVNSNLSVYGFDGLATTERLYISSEMKHSYKEGSDIEVHVHWAPTTNGTGNVKWQLYYSWQKKDGAYTTPTLLSAVSAARGTAWQNTYISLGTISGVGMTMNSQIVFHLFRDPSDVQDTYSSDAAFIALGVHFEKDMVGSHQQLIK